MQAKEDHNKSLLLKKSASMLLLILISNLFSLLISMVDGIVASHYLGPNALNSVNLITPYIQFVGALCAVVAQGTSIILSRSLADSDGSLSKDIIKTMCLSSLVLMAFVGLAGVPIAHLFINSYHLSATQNALTWEYTQGLLIGLVIGAATTPATYLFITMGKADILVILSVAEGLTNLVLDILFVGPLDMGIAGAGYATAISNGIRLLLSIILLQKELHLFPLAGKASGRIALDMMKAGLFPAIFALSFSIRGYIVNRLILTYTGQTGMTAYSVSKFLITLCSIITMGIIQVSQPSLGMSIKFDARKTVASILKWNLTAGFVLTGSIAAVTIVCPSLVYYIYGIIPQGVYQENVARIIGVYGCIRCISTVLLNYMNNREMKYTASGITMAESIVLIPLFAILLQLISSYGVFLSFPVSGSIVLLVCLILVHSLHKNIKKNDERIGFWERQLHPHEGSAFSEQLSKELAQFGLSKKAIYRISLCAEEATSHVRKLSNESEAEPSIDFIINLYKDHADMFIINDGKSEKRINDFMDEDILLPMPNNYFLMKKTAKHYNFRQHYDLNTYSVKINY